VFPCRPDQEFEMAKPKGISWFVTDKLGFRKTHLPAADARLPPRGLETVLRTLRRRLDDKVADVFHAACVSGDLEVAEKLLAILEDMHERRRRQFENDRRQISDEAVVRARKELERCRATPRPDLS